MCDMFCRTPCFTGGIALNINRNTRLFQRAWQNPFKEGNQHSYSSVVLNAPADRDIIRKKSDRSTIKIAIVTENPFKKLEFDKALGKTYGIALQYLPQQVLTEKAVRDILLNIAPSPHYILREETRLIDPSTSIEVDYRRFWQNERELPSILCNESLLQVWKPIWNAEGLLERLEYQQFHHGIKGSIRQASGQLPMKLGFGWDPWFVNLSTGKTNAENLSSPWGKNSARQMVMGDFLRANIFYKKPKELQFNQQLRPSKAIEFTADMSVGHFINTNPYLSNPHLSHWFLDGLFNRVLNEGVFFKASTSRPIKNYFTPPVGGIPLTAKKSAIEETIFMAHDIFHHLIPDLVFDCEDSEFSRYVYISWRMMSEAMTLVLADMLYADTLVQSNPQNEAFIDQRIYPLYKALKKEPLSTLEERKSFIIKLLKANVDYAVLGDDASWKQLLRESEEEALERYKSHFEKFFVGDHIWSASNFENMAADKTHFKQWVQKLGLKQFTSAHIPLLSDMCEKIRARGASGSSLKEIIPHIFMEILETRIFPQDKDLFVALNEEERSSRAFQRYMIGQMSFYVRYGDLPGMAERSDAIHRIIQQAAFFDQKTRTSIYGQYERDVRYVRSLDCLTAASENNYLQLHPIFPPVYISYARQEYKTVKEVMDKIYLEAFSFNRGSQNPVQQITSLAKQLRLDKIPIQVENYRQRHLLEKICSNIPQYHSQANLEDAVQDFLKNHFLGRGSFSLVGSMKPKLMGKPQDPIFFINDQNSQLSYIVKAFGSPRLLSSQFMPEISALDHIKELALPSVIPIEPLAMAIYSGQDGEWGLLLESAPKGKRIDRYIFAVSQKPLGSSERVDSLETAKKALYCMGKSLAQLHAKKSSQAAPLPSKIFLSNEERLIHLMHDRHIVEDLKSHFAIADFIDYVKGVCQEVLHETVFYSHFHGDAHLRNMFYEEGSDRSCFTNIAKMHRSINIQGEPLFEGTLDLSRASESLHKESLLFLTKEEIEILQQNLFYGYEREAGCLPDKSLLLFYRTHLKLERLISNSRYFEKLDPSEQAREKAIYLDAIEYFKEMLENL